LTDDPKEAANTMPRVTQGGSRSTSTTSRKGLVERQGTESIINLLQIERKEYGWSEGVQKTKEDTRNSWSTVKKRKSEKVRKEEREARLAKAARREKEWKLFRIYLEYLKENEP
jgi:hypothetical protein